MNQTQESGLPNDIVYPIVECPHGPHEVVAFLVNDPNGEICMVFCPVHRTMLNQHTAVAFRAWLTAEELRERGFDILV